VPSGLSTLERNAAVAARTVQAIPDAVTIEGGFPVAMDGATVGAIAFVHPAGAGGVLIELVESGTPDFLAGTSHPPAR